MAVSDSGGKEYFWMARRVIKYYKIDQNEFDDVLAESVFLAFIAPHELSYTLIRWAVTRAIKMNCVKSSKYTLIPFSEVDDTWTVFQPEAEDKIVNLEKFRTLKKSSQLLSIAPVT